MCRARLWSAIGFVTALALFARPSTAFGQDAATRQKSAQEAAVAYAKAYNLSTGRSEEVLKVAATPFFPGSVSYGGSGPRIPISAPVLKDVEELSRWLNPGVVYPAREDRLALEVRRVVRYADFRSKYLAKEPEPDDLGDLGARLWHAAREALDGSVGKDGLIVFLGGKSGRSEGVLVRFDNKGVAKIAGVLGNTNPELSTFSVVRPVPDGGK